MQVEEKHLNLFEPSELCQFKLIVKDKAFYTNVDEMSKLSPIFAATFVSIPRRRSKKSKKHIEPVEEDPATREIVDEKAEDILLFLRCLTANTALKLITADNFGTVLRLAKKYQVDSLIVACEQFVLKEAECQKRHLKELVILLRIANEFHLDKSVLAKVIELIAAHDKNSFVECKLSRVLSANVYGAIIGANLNLTRIKELENMNGHMFRVEKGDFYFRRGTCCECKRIVDTTNCEGCRKDYCSTHSRSIKCESDRAAKTIANIKENMVELELLD